MRKLFSKKIIIHLFMLFAMVGLAATVHPAHAQACAARPVGSLPACTTIDTGDLGFQIPTLGDILTFIIRAFFVIAGIVALFYMMLGALSWVTSGGDKDAVTAAREKIQAALIGVILIVVVLALIWTLEQVIFNRRICLGLSCPVTLPGLIEQNSSGQFCCACVNQNGSPTTSIDAFTQKCCPDGSAVPIGGSC